MNRQEIYDLLGLGFGPAGIALAVAMKDEEEAQGIRNNRKSLFLERASDSTWQPEMLLPETNIQHHFLRDFATPRNPRSHYTFVNYLKQKNRLFSFGHIGGIPGRIEWSDYVKWVADQVSDNTLYNHEVIEVQPVLNKQDQQVECVKVVARDRFKQDQKEFLANNIVVSTGRRPNIPKTFQSLTGPKVFHATQFKSKMNQLDKNRNYTFTVVGSGQNAIEIILHLANHYADSEIFSINRNTGFRLYDLGHFSNEVYFPHFTDYFYSISKSDRNKLLQEMWGTNYGAVDNDVSHALFWKVYEESVMGKNRIHVTKCTEVAEARELDSNYELLLKNKYSGQTEKINTDVIILCTGFAEQKVPTLLQPLTDYLCLDEEGDLKITRDYQLETVDNFIPNIFVNGLTEKTHGISDAASFSMIAVKAQRILDKMNQLSEGRANLITEEYQHDFISQF